MLSNADLQPPWGPDQVKDVIGMLNKGKSLQTTAADLAAQPMIMAEFAGNIRDAYIVINEVFGTGEDLVIDIQKLPAGGGAAATVLTATYNLLPTDLPNTKISLRSLLDPTKLSFLPGETFVCVRTGYTAGGGPTAPANLVVIELSI